MATARLLVERGSLKDQSEDWGDHDFVALPSPGDRIAAPRGNETHYLTVLCVHHQIVASAGAAVPSAQVVAKWTGSG